MYGQKCDRSPNKIGSTARLDVPIFHISFSAGVLYVRDPPKRMALPCGDACTILSAVVLPL